MQERFSWFWITSDILNKKQKKTPSNPHDWVLGDDSSVWTVSTPQLRSPRNRTTAVTVEKCRPRTRDRTGFRSPAVLLYILLIWSEVFCQSLCFKSLWWFGEVAEPFETAHFEGDIGTLTFSLSSLTGCHDKQHASASPKPPKVLKQNL